MAARKAKEITREQASVIARGKLEGKSQAEIAREAGVSVSTVSHAASHPQVAPLMRRLLAKYDSRLVALYGRVLASVEKDLDADEPWARIQSRDQALKLIQSADAVTVATAGGADASGEEEGTYTLRELLVTYRRALRGEAPQ